MFDSAGIFVLVLLAVVVFYLLRAIRMVPQGYNYTVERFAVISGRCRRGSA
jgi:regulator of protease activity HflC (stomatin/prohibitin superfamily)